MARPKIVFDSERDMEEFLHETWFEMEDDWIDWPELPEGCEFEERESEDCELLRQVRIDNAGDAPGADAPIDMIQTRWFRTPDMPEGQYLARAVMLIELKNEPINSKHLDQILRYFEAFKGSVERGDETAELICCALVGTGLVSGMKRILDAIPFVSMQQWQVSADNERIGLGYWSLPDGWYKPKLKTLAPVIPIDNPDPGAF
jgi:hypothetical protein